VSKTVVKSHCNKIREVFDCAVIETRALVPYFYYMHASVGKIFKQTIIVIEDVF